MAKFIKSIFQPTEKKHHHDSNSDEDRADTPPMGGRRQLSISRSGRMRQANKKRYSLALDLYGDNEDIQPVEIPECMEYHVHPICQTTAAVTEAASRRHSDGCDPTSEKPRMSPTAELDDLQNSRDTKLRVLSDDEKSPEEEIENAFKSIDKS